MKKAIVGMVLLCFLSLTGSGCQKKDSDAIALGFNLELTGKLAQYGQNCMDGATLAVQQINASGGLDGHLIQMIALDNRSENADAALAALKLGEDLGVSAIIGPTNSNLSRSALSSGAQIPMIIPSATADELVPENAVNNMFRVCYTDSVQGWAMGYYAWALGLQRAAIITEGSSDYSRGISEAFTGKFCELGGEIVEQVFYTTGECDFYSLLTRLAKQDFDALFIPGYYAEAGLIIRQMNELGIQATVLSGDAFDSPALEEIVGRQEYLSNIYFTNHYAPGNSTAQEFIDAFTEAYGREPSAYAALGYDSVMLFADAYLRMGSGDPIRIHNSLEQTEDFVGVTGLITIDEDHNAQKDVQLIQIQEGRRSAALSVHAIAAMNSAQATMEMQGGNRHAATD